MPIVSYLCSSPNPPPVPAVRVEGGNRRSDAYHELQPAIALPNYGHLVNVQRTFEEILEPLSGGALALSLQFSEIALRDLFTSIEYSDLPEKQYVMEQIEGFVSEADDAGLGLRTLGSEVGSVVDRFVDSLHHF